MDIYTLPNLLGLIGVQILMSENQCSLSFFLLWTPPCYLKDLISVPCYITTDFDIF